jgi:hypothetical protein
MCGEKWAEHGWTRSPHCALFALKPYPAPALSATYANRRIAPYCFPGWSLAVTGRSQPNPAQERLINAVFYQ